MSTLSEVRRKMALCDWHHRLTAQEADAVRAWFSVQHDLADAIRYALDEDNDWPDVKNVLRAALVKAEGV